MDVNKKWSNQKRKNLENAINRKREKYINNDAVDLLYSFYTVLYVTAPRCKHDVLKMEELLKAANGYKSVESLSGRLINYAKSFNDIFKDIDIDSEQLKLFQKHFFDLVFEKYLNEKNRLYKETGEYSVLCKEAAERARESKIKAYFPKDTDLDKNAYSINFKGATTCKIAGYMYFNDKFKSASSNVELCNKKVINAVVWEENKFTVSLKNKNLVIDYADIQNYEAYLISSKIVTMSAVSTKTGNYVYKRKHAKAKIYLATDEAGITFFESDEGLIYKCVTWLRDRFIIHYVNGNKEILYSELSSDS